MDKRGESFFWSVFLLTICFILLVILFIIGVLYNPTEKQTIYVEEENIQVIEKTEPTITRITLDSRFALHENFYENNPDELEKAGVALEYIRNCSNLIITYEGFENVTGNIYTEPIDDYCLYTEYYKRTGYKLQCQFTKDQLKWAIEEGEAELEQLGVGLPFTSASFIAGQFATQFADFAAAIEVGVRQRFDPEFSPGEPTVADEILADHNRTIINKNTNEEEIVHCYFF